MSTKNKRKNKNKKSKLSTPRKRDTHLVFEDMWLEQQCPSE